MKPGRPGTSQEPTMTHSGPSGGHADPAAARPQPKNRHAGLTGSPHRRFRRILGVTGTVLLTVLTLATMLVAGAMVSSRGMHQAIPTGQGHIVRDTAGDVATASAAVTGHRRPIVVAVVAGTSGTVASDLLAPYDIFASSPAFHPYVVAAHTGPVPLEGGPALVPTHTFADVDADPALRPDLVVVPALSKPTGPTDSALRSWVITQHDGGAKVLGVPEPSCSPRRGSSTGCTPPATGRGSALCRRAGRPCTGCGAAAGSRTGRSPRPPPSAPASRAHCTSSPSSPDPPKPNESPTCTRSWAGPLGTRR